jgi:hypothetical protein
MRYLMVLVLAGCATSWHHPSKGEQDFHKDRFACDEKATAAIPFLSGPFDDTREEFVRSCLRARGWRQ